MDNMFGDDDPKRILINELNRSREFFKILSKAYGDKLKKSAKKSIKNIKSMEKYIEDTSYDDLEKIIVEIKNLRKNMKD